MTAWKLLTLPLLSFLPLGPLDEPPRAVAGPDAFDEQVDFALALHRELVAGDPEANVFASPLSVWTALSMLAEGARAETAREFAQALLGPDSELDLAALRGLARALRARLEAAGDDVELHWADALWGQRAFPFAPGVVEALERHYGALLEDLDFVAAPDAARERINAWVEARTRERIRDLLPAGSITPLTRLVLTDAVYFEGKWAEPFLTSATAPLPFQLADGPTVAVPFLRDTDGRTAPVAFLDDGLTALELSYEGGALSFVVLLPRAADGLASLEAELDAERLGRILGALSPRRVVVELPKLELAPAYDLIAPLRGLGFQRLFEPNGADLSGLVDGAAPDLYVTGAYHKAFLKVDEEGTEAAAATGVVVGIRAAAEPPPRVRVDRPFLFLIRERETGALLFLGRVTDPSA